MVATKSIRWLQRRQSMAVSVMGARLIGSPVSQSGDPTQLTTPTFVPGDIAFRPACADARGRMLAREPGSAKRCSTRDTQQEPDMTQRASSSCVGSEPGGKSQPSPRLACFTNQISVVQ
jgi:hypothetical protein